MRWGLTELEAKVYLAVSADSQGGRVRQISKLSGVNRAETYKMLSNLESLGLVEVILARPRIYQLRDPKEIFPSLIERRKNELQSLEDEMMKTAEWIASISKANSPRIKGSDEISPTIVLGGSREGILNRVAAEWRRATSEIVSVIGRDNLVLMFEPFFKNLVQDLLRRGVSFRIVTEVTSKTAREIELIQEFAEVRHDARIALEFDIIDGNKLLLLLSKVGASQEPFLLKTMDRAFVDTMLGLFDKIWDHSVSADMLLAMPTDAGSVIGRDFEVGHVTGSKRKDFVDLIATEAMRGVLEKGSRELQEFTSSICHAWMSKISEEHYVSLDDLYAAHQSASTGLAMLEGKTIPLGNGFFAFRNCPCPVIEAGSTANQEIGTEICEVHREIVRGYADKVTIGSRKLRALLSPKPNGAAWKFEAGDDPSDKKLRRLTELSKRYGCVVAFT
jgi:sugar-specific transcriptional regulator TrmB